ncbi:protein of unknown function [Amycolatopsis marina]|uniref:DUF397 domain-containing protein n=1 Tax=Amycolatopsis marina TaxID=490629 RepID=A0A1I1CH08_9PSEU|nr:DUF397 domain-containing protein [Amycolatopsis marina]SFB61296.1 protein of unknown function [Amycolatopsis marina]
MSPGDGLRHTWRKSTYSNDRDGDCVEVALTPSTTAIRDSKAPTAGHLGLSAGVWRELIRSLRG